MQRLQPRFTLMVQFRQFIEFQLVDSFFFFLPITAVDARAADQAISQC